MGPIDVNASSESLQLVYRHIANPPMRRRPEDTRVFRIVLRGDTIALASLERREVSCPVGIPSKNALE